MTVLSSKCNLTFTLNSAPENLKVSEIAIIFLALKGVAHRTKPAFRVDKHGHDVLVYRTWSDQEQE